MNLALNQPWRPSGRVAFSAAAAFAALHLSWLVWGGSEPAGRLLVGSLSLIFASLTAALLAGRVFISSTGRRRRAWGWMAAGLALGAAAALVRGLAVLLPPSSLAGASADWLGLATPLAIGAGLVLTIRPAAGENRRRRLLFDAAIVTAALAVLAWIALVQPAAALSGQPFSPIRLHPLVDLAMLLLVTVIFLLPTPDPNPPLAWIAAGLLASTLSDLSLALLPPGPTYQPGTPLDFGWLAGSLCLALAATSSLRLAPAQPRPAAQRLVGSIRSLLPVLAVLLLAWFSLLQWQLQGQANPLGLWVSVVLALGVIARQGMLAGEVEMEKYATLVNSVAAPAFICDGSGRIRLANPALSAAAGFTAAGGSPAGRSLFQLVTLPFTAIPPGGWDGEATLNRLEGTGLPVHLALRLLQPAPGAASHSAMRRRTNPVQAAFAGTAHDLSAIKQQQAALQSAYEQVAAARTELQLLNRTLEARVAEKTSSLSEAYRRLEAQNEALQQLDRLKSDFVSLVSHELRAPLTNISGGIELELAGAAALPARSAENLALVQAEIRRLTRFVETILDLSALDAGRQPLHPAPVALPAAAASLRARMEGMPGAERITWRLPDGLPAFLADERALHSILFHLLDNALKYAPGSPVTVEAGAAAGQGWLRVSDAGPGIPEDALPRLFERFQRLNAADSQAVYGHGLGLYIVRRLLEAMGGQVEAANHPPHGAVFTCRLPLAEGAED